MDTKPTQEHPESASLRSGDLFGVMTNREHDLIVALRQLCDATEKQCAANEGKESILVRVKRNNAKRILEKYDPLSSPNTEVSDAKRSLD